MTVSRISISLVTPCRNGATYLAQAMDSVLSQKGDFDLEYIIVDGVSDDGTLDIIRAREDRLTGWGSEPDGGMYDALSKGLERTSGEVMGWINSDDVYFPWALDTVARVFADLPEVEWISTLNPAAIDTNGDIFGIRRIAGFARDAFLDGVYVGFDGLGNPLATNFIQQESTFWRRSLWDKLGPDPLGRYRANRRPAGDFALWCMFYEHVELYGIEAPLCGWRMHPGQWTEAETYQTEVAIELDGMRARLNHTPNLSPPDGFAHYEGTYVVKADLADPASKWRTVEKRFFVAPKSDVKTALGHGWLF